MTRRVWCTGGHQWEISLEEQSKAPLTCPVCGAAPMDPSLTPPAIPLADTSQVDLPTWLDPPAAKFTDSPASKMGLLPSSLPGCAFPDIPGYAIERELGSGGMGVVYQARHLKLKRPVALKMILAGARVHAGALARFQTEAEAVARLQHPNIVQIYEIGTHQGQPYLVLELVPGGSLAQKLQRGLPTPRQAAEWVETLARAVQHAHEQGVIHRDLKPANVLLSVVGSAASAARAAAASPEPRTTDQGQVPKITDFGLAKRTDDSGQTRSGDILGTPNYMAPEQAAGHGHEVGPACDVYALGAILYECLIGQPPFRGANTVEVLRNVISLEPVAPRSLQPRVPRDLQTICLTCLGKQPEQRYPTAAALADDLRRFLVGEPILARPPQGWERMRGWVRHQPVVALLLAIFGVGGAGAALALWAPPAVAVGTAAVLGLLLGGWWNGDRLRLALREVDQHHLRAERNVERLHLLLETTQKLIGVRNTDELLRLLSEMTTRLVNAERATIYLVDRTRNELWSKLALGEEQEIRIPLGSGIAGTVAQTGEPINLSDPYHDARFNQEVDRRTGYVTRNLLTLPMAGRSGRVLGVFQVLNKRGGPFTGEDVELLAALAASAAVAVEVVG